MKIIAFAGLARAGKTSAAQFVSDILGDKGKTVVRASFAGPIRDGLKEFGITKEQFYTHYRDLAQYIGAYCRGIEDQWWVQVTMNKAAVSATFADYFIIDDVRYPNEVQALRDAGAVLVYVDAHKRLGEELDNSLYLHESEGMARTFTRLLLEGHSSPLLEKFDVIIDSNETYEAHLANVREWMEKEILNVD